MQVSPLFAHLGLDAREHHPPPDGDLDEFCCWTSDTFAVTIRPDDGLPPGVLGMAVYHDPIPGQRGAILLRPGTWYPRYILAHELGHIETGTATAVSMFRTPMPEVLGPAEQAADDWATMFLLAIDDIWAAFAAGDTLYQIAERQRVPPRLVGRRCELSRFLGEFSPERYDGCTRARWPSYDRTRHQEGIG